MTLQPGEFVHIPRGCAFASVTDGRSRHLSVLTSGVVPAVREPVRHADVDVAGWLAAHGGRAEAAAEAVHQ